MANQYHSSVPSSSYATSAASGRGKWQPAARGCRGMAFRGQPVQTGTGLAAGIATLHRARLLVLLGEDRISGVPEDAVALHLALLHVQEGGGGLLLGSL